MTIHLYVDEDAMDQDLVRSLRARGVNLTTALEEDMIERSDQDHLDYATDEGRYKASRCFAFGVCNKGIG